MARGTRPWIASFAACCLSASLSCNQPASPGATFHVPGRQDTAPWIAASGSFVAVAWGARLEEKLDVFVAVSRDGGQTFGAPVQVNAVPGEARLGGELPPRVAVMSPPGSSSPDVVVLWTARGERTEIKSARSRDGGRTFDAPVTLQSPGAAGDRGWPALAVDPRGAHAVWIDHRGLAANRPDDAGSGAHHHGAAHDGAAMAQKSGLYYAAVSDGPIAERAVTMGVCYCCKTALAAGADGSLYAAWRHVYPGNLRDIAFTASRDGGRTFSSPVRVSEDNWAINGCPDDGPAMAVDKGGTVHLLWPTVIGGSQPEGALFYASTRDGVRFSTRVRVPTLGGLKPAHPQIAVTDDGRVFVAWDENIEGRHRAGVRELKRQSDGAASFGDVVTLGGDAPASYPVLANTGRGVMAVWIAGREETRIEARSIGR